VERDKSVGEEKKLTQSRLIGGHLLSNYYAKSWVIKKKKVLFKNINKIKEEKKRKRKRKSIKE
jgi:hypothetical protein